MSILSTNGSRNICKCLPAARWGPKPHGTSVTAPVLQTSGLHRFSSTASLGLGIDSLDGWGMQVLTSPGLARVFFGCRNSAGDLQGCRPLGESHELSVSTAPLIRNFAGSLG